MNELLKIITLTPEYQSFGLNLITASFALTLFLAIFLQLPGLYDQARKIWKNKSAVGVNTGTFIIFLTYFLIFVIYSYSLPSGAGLLNGIILLPLQFIILAGLFKFSKPSWVSGLTALAATTLTMLALLFPEYREKIFTMISIATFGALWLQPLEMLKNKTVRNVSKSFARNFLIVALVWAIYGAIIGAWYISGASAAFASAYGVMLVLWYKFRDETAQEG